MTHDSAAPSYRPGRRGLVAGIAWAAPAVAISTLAPAVAASPGQGVIDVGNVWVQGTCATFGITVEADAAPLPIGTTITVTSTVEGAGPFTVTGTEATIEDLSSTEHRITLSAPLPEGTALAIRSALGAESTFRLTAVLALPEGYTVGAGAKLTGALEADADLGYCAAT
jgi:hypothetical protein